MSDLIVATIARIVGVVTLGSLALLIIACRTIDIMTKE